MPLPEAAKASSGVVGFLKIPYNTAMLEGFLGRFKLMAHIELYSAKALHHQTPKL